eukprot:gb/GECH01012964.1/.p1 GENE.gb/GECH01012964.1/~~gb/GECH01012964.1/.p1  ORF type:complete len:414 (+),score=107.95 gb/GECH01012964.1/:1-1242(+)
MNVQLYSPHLHSDTSLSDPTVEDSKKPKVRVACVNCNKAHTCCSNSRPCERCVRLGLTDSCVDIVPKKRGPKRRSNNSSPQPKKRRCNTNKPKKQKKQFKKTKQNKKQNEIKEKKFEIPSIISEQKISEQNSKPSFPPMQWNQWNNNIDFNEDDLTKIYPSEYQQMEQLLINLAEQPPLNLQYTSSSKNTSPSCQTDPQCNPTFDALIQSPEPRDDNLEQTLQVAKNCLKDTGCDVVPDLNQMQESYDSEEENKKQQVLNNEGLSLRLALNSEIYSGMYRKVGIFISTNLPFMDYVSPEIVEKWGFQSQIDMFSHSTGSYLNLIHPYSKGYYQKTIERMHSWKPSDRKDTTRKSRGKTLLSLTFDDNNYPIKKVGRALALAQDGAIFEFVHECNIIRDQSSRFRYCVCYVYWV